MADATKKIKHMTDYSPLIFGIASLAGIFFIVTAVIENIRNKNKGR
jgi:hypothetical protein